MTSDNLSTDPTTEIRGLQKMLRRLRGAFGPLEWLIILGLAVAIISFLLTAVIVISQGQKIEETTRNTRGIVRSNATRDMTLIREFADMAAALRALKRSSDQFAQRLAELEAQEPTVVVVHERSRGEDRVIVVTPSPSPQPTATVTCDPTPIIGSCPRGRPR